MILSVLEKSNISLEDCRGQGYDNASSIPAITFFGTVQTVYNFFALSVKRWNILQKHIGVSIHRLSDIRWTARIKCIRSFSNHLPGIISALKELEKLNLIGTIKAKSEVIGAINYLETFQCIIMSSIWFKILAAIDIVNEVIQARSSTIDIEIQNLNNLITGLKDNWSSIVQEAKLVAYSMNIDASFPSFRKRKRTRFYSETAEEAEIMNNDETQFRDDVFFTIIDSVLQGLLKRYNAANNIYKLFGFFWCYLELEDQEIRIACANLVEFYKNDIIQDDFQNEVINLKRIHTLVQQLLVL